MTGQRTGFLLFLTLLLARTSCSKSEVNTARNASGKDLDCSTWFVSVTSEWSSYCECGKSLNGQVRCNNASQEVAILPGYCMSYDESSKQTVLGECLYTQIYYVDSSWSQYGYIPLPNNASDLNSFVCGPYNRDGLLCGRCKDGFSPGVATFIYNHKCVNCSQSSTDYGWLAYIAVQFLPVTILFVIVVVFQVSAVTPSMNAFVFICQLTTLPEFIEFVTSMSKLISPAAAQFQSIIFSIYGVWNLDLFRPLIPNLCFDSDVTTLYAFTLEFTSAAFLLLLTVVTYVCIVLHSRNCRVIVVLWMPFHKCFTRFKRTWNLQSTMIDAFATFLLLCYNKLALICIRLLIHVQVYNSYGDAVGPYLFYYDASVEYFSKEHLPFALISILILATVITIPPLLLMFYQLKAFQKLLNSCCLRCQALRIFVDKYQGCFRDGTYWGRDLRFFAGLYFALRIIFASVVATVLIWPYVLLILSIITSLAFAIVRPYKINFYNKIDSVFFAVLAFAYFCIVFVQKLVFSGEDISVAWLPIASVFILGTLPLIYIIVFTIYWVVFKRKLLHKCLGLCVCINEKRRQSMIAYSDVAYEDTQIIITQNQVTSTQIEGISHSERELQNSLADRIIHPQTYQSLESSLSLPND